MQDAYPDVMVYSVGTTATRIKAAVH